MDWLWGLVGVVAVATLVRWGVRSLGVVAARAVVVPRRRHPTRIHSSTATTVALDASRQTLHPGSFGLRFGADGHALVGDIRGYDPGEGIVTRELLGVTGDLATADRGHWGGDVHAGADALGRWFADVALPVPGGLAPAWEIRAAGRRPSTTWAVHIHGLGGTRASVLRSVVAADALGMTSVVVSYRGDGEAPAVDGRCSSLGAREWADVDAALAYARDRGAERVVLFGWSLGGAIALQLTERSAHRDLIERLVLIGPVTDWRAVIRQGARERRLPGFVASAAMRTLYDELGSSRVGLPEPIDFAQLDWTRPDRLRVPTLVIHSAGDREVPLSASVMFAMANPSLVRLIETPPAEHTWEYNVDPQGFTETVVEFLASAREDDRLG